MERNEGDYRRAEERIPPGSRWDADHSTQAERDTREALRMYADPDNYRPFTWGGAAREPWVVSDGGKTARRALGMKEV